MKKRRILISTDWFLPAFKAGGPVKSIENLVDKLKDEFEFDIMTSDRDVGDLNAFENVETNTWISKKAYRVQYISPENLNYSFLKNIVNTKTYDVIYLNSMFSSKFTILPLLLLYFKRSSIRIVLAPRGMLGEGALKLKSFKKRVFLSATKLLGLYGHIEWHATAINEKKEIENVFSNKLKIHTISNIPSLFSKSINREKIEDNLNLLFYSRISPKKNLLGALSFLENLSVQGNIDFKIYGPAEDQEYLKVCKKLAQRIEKNNAQIRIDFCGPVKPDDIEKIFSKSHVLFFPTQHENYGHVIAEAMSSGLPVIISDKTPWIDLEAENVGYAIDLNDKERWQNAIRDFLSMNQETYDKYSNSSHKYAHEMMFDTSSLEQYKEMFS